MLGNTSLFIVTFWRRVIQASHVIIILLTPAPNWGLCAIVLSSGLSVRLSVRVLHGIGG